MSIREGEAMTGRQRTRETRLNWWPLIRHHLADVIEDSIRRDVEAADRQIKPKSLRSACLCRRRSYIGGWCFGCGRYRPSTRARDPSRGRGLGTRLREFGWPPNS